MVKKCIYCKIQIDENSVVDVCKRCGVGVWGERMFSAIIQSMEGAKKAGDLYQGSITMSTKIETKVPATTSIKSLIKAVEKTNEEIESKEILSYSQEIFPSSDELR
jgi:hypothetical protein